MEVVPPPPAQQAAITAPMPPSRIGLMTFIAACVALATFVLGIVLTNLGSDGAVVRMVGVGVILLGSVCTVACVPLSCLAIFRRHRTLLGILGACMTLGLAAVLFVFVVAAVDAFRH